MSQPQYSPADLTRLNTELANQNPQQILEWAIDNVQGLFQTTAFGLTGMAAVDMISKISLARNQIHLVPLIFLDTLYHFEETLQLAKTAEETYLAPLHVYRPPEVANVAEFEAKYGQKLWETDEETYDFLVKVEPAQRAYKELGVRAVITGRRRSQGADRADLPVIELDSTGLLKINPLINWSFKEVREYIDKEGVPYNALLDKGYRSVGDWHSTAPPSDKDASDAGERAGRWQGKSKSECGLHRDFYEMKAAFEAKQQQPQQPSSSAQAATTATPAVDAAVQANPIPTFARGAVAILELWPALRLAVAEELGGPESAEKRTWMASEVVDYFESAFGRERERKESTDESRGDIIDVDDLADMLFGMVSDEFDLDLEDKSEEEVAKQIVKLWKAVVRGETLQVEELERAASTNKGKKQSLDREQEYDEDGNPISGDEDGSEEDEDDDAMDVDDKEAPELVEARPTKHEPVVDEDGFELVQKKRR